MFQSEPVTYYNCISLPEYGLRQKPAYFKTMDVMYNIYEVLRLLHTAYQQQTYTGWLPTSLHYVRSDCLRTCGKHYMDAQGLLNATTALSSRKESPVPTEWGTQPFWAYTEGTNIMALPVAQPTAWSLN
jgi:hypothetical protein